MRFQPGAKIRCTSALSRTLNMKDSLLVVLAVASLALLSIIAMTGVGAVEGADRINNQIALTGAMFQQTERTLNRLRADLDAARLSVRDYIIDPASKAP